MALALTSAAFAHNGAIPKQYTCQGAEVSVPLAWSSLPAGTKSLALIVDDPDAPDPAKPQRTWVHWVVPSLPAGAHSLGKGATPPAGKNDWGKTEYGGPCPPIGRHRYFFKLYALDAPLGDLGAPAKAALERAMQGHVLGRAELVGTYERAR